MFSFVLTLFMICAIDRGTYQIGYFIYVVDSKNYKCYNKKIRDFVPKGQLRGKIMAKIMQSGWVESDIIRPRAEFGISIIATAGSITGNWFLFYSPNDGENWKKAQDTAFSDTDSDGSFNLPDGFICKLMGGTVDSVNTIEVYAGYKEDRLIKSIESDVVENPDRT